MSSSRSFCLCSSSVLSVVTLLLAFQRHVSALTCYETSDDGSLAEVTNDAWNYCSMIPSYYEGEELHAGKAFGLGPMNDFTDGYDLSFHAHDPFHTVLSFCVYEKYDFGKFSPKHGIRRRDSEFLFRCVCNTDKCNDPNLFRAFLPPFPVEE
ncbi:hypothetical protein AAVH_21016 [Aphelenchoides avenae]|nr:hypothetical protein AAVH_21016 [Aphelenchus avenae]